MEVVVRNDDGCLVRWNTSNPIPPGPRNLDGTLHGFGAAVHGKNHLHAHQFGEFLGKCPQKIVVKGSRRQRHRAKLAPRCSGECGVTVTKVDRRVGGQAVQILLAFNVFHPRALGAFRHNRQRVVVVGKERVLER